MVFQVSSRSLDASKTPSLLTPTWVICLNELGAGDEIDLREIEPLLESDFDRNDPLLLFLDSFVLFDGASHR